MNTVSSSEPLYLCVPNFSDGRRRAVLDRIAAAVEVGGGTVMDQSMDADHNRAVVAFFGTATAVAEAVTLAAAAAIEEIDLREHSGEHPRFGAVDVVPIVPLRDADMDQAVALSRLIGQRLADELSLPVYLYEKSAVREDRASLAAVRSIGAESLLSPLTGANAPDFGPHAFHPTAGAVAVGARDPLVAYNVNLDTPDPAAARRIAAAIRAERDAGEGMAGVRALGLVLSSRSITQVSTNVTAPDICPVRMVYDFIAGRAEDEGARVLMSELIGVVSRRHLPPVDAAAMRFSGLRKTQFIEHWLQQTHPAGEAG